ncbi:mucin-5B-like [Antedon mediterranea]|uniref:mucin-5B-like n=1 Tax=Antedon mediterranea TaxID=105859 RepID=UPI003AF85331
MSFHLITCLFWTFCSVYFMFNSVVGDHACPFNQINKRCARACQQNCKDYVQGIHTASILCNRKCARCKCEDGLYLDDDEYCVAPEFCGCYNAHLDEYFKIGDKFLIDAEICECVEFQTITCTGIEGVEGSGSFEIVEDPVIKGIP